MPVLSSSHRRYLLDKARILKDENRGAPETLRCRSQALQSWRKFVGRARPTEELVWLYIVNEIDRNRKLTGIKTYLSGIKKHFVLSDPGLQDEVFASVRIKETLKQGRDRLRKAGQMVKRAVVISEVQVEGICNAASDYDSTLFAALVVSMFYNLSRGAELVLPSHSRSQRANKIPLCGNVSLSRRRTIIRIHSQKNDQYRPVDLDFNVENCPGWALDTLYEYGKARSNDAHDLQAFPEFFLRSNTAVPTTDWLMRRMKKALGNDYTIHGLRAGGATRLAKLGFTAFQIQLAGRWTSDAFIAYISDNESIAIELAKKGNLPERAVRRRRA